jgi:hypothetical protein
MLRYLCLAAIAAITLATNVAPASAQDQATPAEVVENPVIERIEVLDFGVYAANRGDCPRDERGIQRCEIAEIQHVTTTTTIPAELGLLFGVRYRVVGAPVGATAQLRRVWTPPAPGLRSPTIAEPIDRIERPFSVPIGEPKLASYRFDDEWELVPGLWRVELWDGERLLLSSEFTVTTPSH